MEDLYRIRAGYENEYSGLAALTDLKGAFAIYWLYYTSAQSIHSKFWVDVLDYSNGLYIDISRGIKNIEHTKESRVMRSKHTEYIKEMSDNYMVGKIIVQENK